MKFKETFAFFYKSPKQFSKKQKLIIAAWTILNLLLMVFYLMAGCSFIIAFFNAVIGISIILLYFTRLLAFAISPIIYVLLSVLSVVRLVNKPDLKTNYEWSDAIWFATIAATVIRTYFIEAYTIPTSSMEKSLLVGDFLFVSKMNYGTRLPETPLSFPFTHNKLPFTDSTASFLTWLKMPYFRTPAFQKIKNNDVVVFNYPAEFDKPDDKKENYIKRCLAIPGDSIEVRNAQVYINGIAAENPPKMQFKYYVKLNEQNLATEADYANLQKRYQITEVEPIHQSPYEFGIPLSNEMRDKMSQDMYISKIDSLFKSKTYFENYIYPYNEKLGWNVDWYGPLYVPKAGDIIPMDSLHFLLYERCIHYYEGHPDVKMENGQCFIDGKVASNYQFKYNYYFMMGDNRHNSADSRFWGFVPETHIVGKAMFVWMSLDANESNLFKKVRWSRLFKGIH